MAVETFEVCKICFNFTSHKANPTLTLTAKVDSDDTRSCPACKQEWSTQTVAKDPDTRKWVAIRPRPKIDPKIDYQLCVSTQRKQPCQKGPLGCTYAHSRAELILWNKTRLQQPRPAPMLTGPYQFQLCKHIQGSGVCPYGQRCTFAHSEEELERWINEQQGGVVPSDPAMVSPPLMSQGEGYYCHICNLRCTSNKQLEDHLSGVRHRQAQATLEHYQNLSVRPRPYRVPVNGFKLCTTVLSGRHCYYGDRCTFAHSEDELRLWNEDFTMYPYEEERGYAPPRYQAPPPNNVTTSMSCDLDEFDNDWRGEEEGGDRFDTDFAQILRQQVIKEGQDKLPGLETTRDNVTIVDISGTGETMTVANSNQTKLEWVYEVSTTAPRQLVSVVLCDVLAADFTLDEVQLVAHHTQQLVGTPANIGEGLLLDHAFRPSDKVLVKVTLTPRPGVLGQLVLFDFSDFYLVRCITVHVVSEQEDRMIKMAANTAKKRPEKIDLFWEQRYTLIEWGSSMFGEETDLSLAEYPLPEQVETLIDKGKYQNVETKITKENYCRRMHNLLYVEEYQQRKDLSRYDLYDIEVYPEQTLELPTGEMVSSTDSYYVNVMMEETLFEGGRSVRGGDLAMLRPAHQTVVHECVVDRVTRDCVVLRMSHIAKEACKSSRHICSLRFVPTRVPMRSMHQAVDTVLLDTVFPSSTSTDDTTPTNIQRCLQELSRTELNQTQQKAVQSMLDPVCRIVPSLVLGPFGCGKTRTLFECIKLLMLYTDSTHLLVCTHSNSAADLYVEYLHKQWTTVNKTRAPLLRLYYTFRNLNTISTTVRQYCRVVGDRVVDPPIHELSQYKIVVSTLHNVRKLWLADLKPGFFTHIFIDEAAQALESEADIALCLADRSTKVVLAGDHMQMDPPVYSEIARKYRLNLSLLERLFDHPAYNTGIATSCKTLLTENHRSHYMILELPSKLFYQSKLTCKAVLPNDGPTHIPPLQFIGVDGKEEQSEDSPSYYNYLEAIAIVEQVETVIRSGLVPSSVCVLAYYKQQVQLIRQELKRKRLGAVNAVRVDDVQGKEYRALLISTVRTCASDPDENEEGFLSNVKLFNTAITRARQWLVVVGDPVTLCTVGYNSPCWMELIRKCIEQQTFKYHCPNQFERFLETRVVTRLVLQHRHGQQMTKKIAPPSHTAQTFSQPYSAHTVPSVNPLPSAHSGPPPPSSGNPTISVIAQETTAQMSRLSLQQQQTQIVHSRVTAALQSPDNTIATRITEEIVRMDPALLSEFISRDDFVSRVREFERTLSRAAVPTVTAPMTRLPPAVTAPMANTRVPPAVPTATAPMANTRVPPASLSQVPMANMRMPTVAAASLSQVAPLSHPHLQHQPASQVSTASLSMADMISDLPVFLTQQLEALTVHNRYCDGCMVQPALPIQAATLLHQQKSLLEHQMRLMNQQILKYREYAKIMATAVHANVMMGRHPMAAVPPHAHTQPHAHQAAAPKPHNVMLQVNQQPPVARTQLISPLSNPPNGHSQYSPMDHVSYRHQQQQHTNYRGGYSQPAAGQQDLVYMSDEEL